MKKKKVLIMNAIPTNIGDAALVFALRDRLIDAGCEVSISTAEYTAVKELYPELEWIKAEHQLTLEQREYYKINPDLKLEYFDEKVKENKQTDNVDFIISAPGGYINSYYGFIDKLYCMEQTRRKSDSKLVMYSQSVGPLGSRDTATLKRYIDKFDLFMARDSVSFDNVKYYDNSIQTNDAAFLLKSINCVEKKESGIVGISVREWRYDDRDKEKYKKLIKSLAYKCIDSGKHVEFISTCQGISTYVDDSKIADEILSEFDEEYKKYVQVNRNYYKLDEFRTYISKFDYVIGTRLHMCILSMLSGVPAFNISYEIKGKECYKMMQLSEYSIDYNEDVEKGLSALDKFIENIDTLYGVYQNKVREMQIKAEESFQYMIKNIF